MVQHLTEENYNTWNSSILVALDAKSKLGFIDGSIPKPQETDPHYTAWCKCNGMVLAWLFNSLRNYNLVLYTSRLLDMCGLIYNIGTLKAMALELSS